MNGQPSQIGPYRLLRKIGQGGMAEVFLAVTHGASGFEKKVAVKMLRPELRGRGEYERILIEEAKLGARLQHRNLLQVHDLGMDSGVYYVRMDYVDGADLSALMRKRKAPLSVELSLLVGEEVALALDYVHRFTDESGRPLGLVHRDISPSNILLSRAGEVKLADFGIAKATNLADGTGGQVHKGKYAYMSPEQVEYNRVTARSDQFSFGVTLMELLCGRRPYDAPSVPETMELIRQAAPPDLSGFGGRLEELIRRCLKREPQERFAGAEELRRQIALIRRYVPPAAPNDLGNWVTKLLDTKEPADEPASNETPVVTPTPLVTPVLQSAQTPRLSRS